MDDKDGGLADNKFNDKSDDKFNDKSDDKSDDIHHIQSHNNKGGGRPQLGLFSFDDFPFLECCPAGGENF